MNTPERPPRKKRTAETEAEQTQKVPAGNETRDEGTPSDRDGKPSEEEVIVNRAHPMTNQDEQQKITNADKGDIPMPDK